MGLQVSLTTPTLAMRLISCVTMLWMATVQVLLLKLAPTTHVLSFVTVTLLLSSDAGTGSGLADLSLDFGARQSLDMDVQKKKLLIGKKYWTIWDNFHE